MAEDRHPGINMHKFTVGGGFVGLVFAAGSALIFVLGFPTLWYFVALAFALGLGIAIVLKIASHHLSERGKPLSILAIDEKTKGPALPQSEKRLNVVHTVPKPISA